MLPIRTLIILCVEGHVLRLDACGWELSLRIVFDVLLLTLSRNL